MALDRPSDKEHEYFKMLEQEQRKKLRASLDQKREQEKKDKAKTEHWMKCPKCGADLKEIKVQEVAVDECTSCKGVWLDNGELEILLKSGDKEKAGIFERFFSKKK